MPKEIPKERLTEFLGLFTNADTTNISKNTSPACQNVRPMLGGLKSRGGHEKINITSYNEPIRELFILPMASGFFGNQAGGGIGTSAGDGGTDAGAGGSGEGDDDTGSDGGGDIIIIGEDDGDVQETFFPMYFWCRIPRDRTLLGLLISEADEPLYPHLQVSVNSDMSSPWLDAESVDNQAYWQYAQVLGDVVNSVWQSIPSTGTPETVMNGIRLSDQVWWVKFNLPSDYVGAVAGVNYYRFRFWDEYEYGAWSEIKSFTLNI